MIEIKGLTKRYKTRTAVDQLNLNIETGEMFALLGQNGAGKSTTIKMLTCLTKPSEGDALLMKKSILNDQESVKGMINVSPQETAIAKKLSVRENLELMGKLYGLSKKEAMSKAAEMMDKFQLNSRADDKAKQLSGGLKRQLSIAMALISDPEIIFLDEPTLGLDVRARRALWNCIRELKGKITIVLTTHYLEEAEALADHIGIIDQGQLKVVGTVDEIISYANTDTFEDAFLHITEEV